MRALCPATKYDKQKAHYSLFSPAVDENEKKKRAVFFYALFYSLLFLPFFF